MATYNNVITNVSGSVGIGTTNASSRLTVLGNSSLPSEPIATFRPGGSQTGGVGVLDVQNSSGTSLLFVSGSGNVGIGTTSPQVLLHVGAGPDTPTATDTAMLVTNAGTTNLAVRDSTNNVELLNYVWSGGGLLGTVTSHNLYIRTSNTDRVTIDTSGNVGIGTSTYTARLFVSGSSTGTTPSLLVRHGISSGSDLPIAQFQNAAGSNRFTISGSGFVSMTGNEFQQISATNDYYVSHKFYNSGASYLGFVGYQGSTTLNLSNQVTTGNISISTAAQGAIILSAAGIGTGGYVFVNPNDPRVGINTNDPYYTFHIEDVSTAEDCVLYLGGPRAKVLQTSEFFLIGSDSGSGAYSGVAGANFIRSDASPLVIQTTNTERMRIDTSGNVGIGTTSYTARLFISGSSTPSTPTMVVREGVSPTGGVGVLNVQNSAGTSLLFISGSGFTGIGTNTQNATVAGSILHVSSSLAGNASSEVAIGAQLLGTSVNLYRGYTQVFQLAGGTEAMRITAAGNIGIGTNTATARLFVSGSSTASTPTMVVREGVASPTGGTKVFQVLKSDGTGIFHVSGSGDVYLDTGNLVIGTSGKGIDFSATSNAASGTLGQELFDDYEEGTFTPGTTVAGGGTITSSRSGYYTKIGRVVHVKFFIDVSAVSGARTTLAITGLPFQIDVTYTNAFVESYNLSNTGGLLDDFAHSVVWSNATSNSLTYDIYETTSGAPIASPASFIAAGTLIAGHLTYFTNQ